MWGGTSDHDRCPLLQSDGPMWMVMHPPLKPTSSHHVRGWHYLVYRCHHAWDRCTSPTPYKPTSKGSEDMVMPQECSCRAVTQSPDSKTSLEWINGKLLLLLWTSTRAFTEDGWRHKVICSRCRHWKEHMLLAEGMTSLPIDATRWWTPQLTHLFMELGHSLQDQKGWMSWCLPPWCRVLLPNWRGTLATSRKVALYPHYTEQNSDWNKRETRTRW